MESNTQYSELYDILVDKLNNPAVNWTDIAEVREKYGVHENLDTLRKGSKLFYEFLNAGWRMTPPDKNTASVVKETVTINSDKTETSEKSITVDDENKLKDSEYLLRAHGYDPKLFELTQAKNSKWDNGVKTLYASRITVKPKTGVASFDPDEINRLFEKIQAVDKAKIPPTSYNSEANKLLLIPISDLHVNLRATEQITGNEYDCFIAQTLVNHVIDDILENINRREIEKIVFTVGGDMLNADNQNNTTLKGTPQDCDKHLFEAFEDTLSIVLMSLIKLLQVAPVDIVYIPGNHDETVGWFLAKVLEAQFCNDDRVSVDVSPLPRKYYKYGNTLLAFSHDADTKKLPAIVADEAREYWSEIKFTDVFLQHLHNEQILMEDHNMRIQRLPTISGVSKWSNDNGYKSRRMNKAFLYDRDDGLKNVIYTTIKE